MFKKILGAPNALLRTIAEHMAVRWLRDGAAGKHGAVVESILHQLQGKKTIIGCLFGMIGFMAYGLGYEGSFGPTMMTIGSVGVAVGFLDKAVWTPGRPDFLQDSMVYRLAADNAGLISSGLLSAFAWTTGPDCISVMVHSLTLSCAGQSTILLGITLMFVYLGILDQGFLSKTPWQVKRG